jgi:bifunctional non-homologous end joining protein LigD
MPVRTTTAVPQRLPRIAPMLATLALRPPGDAHRYGFEFKWEGVRALAYVEAGRLRIESRNGRDVTHQYPELAPLAAAGDGLILDGEIVALDEHARPSFHRIQHRLGIASAEEARRRAAQIPVVYFVFDLLHAAGDSLIQLPYEERRRRLDQLGLQGDAWATPRAFFGAGDAVLEASREAGLEGVVGRRSPDWLKIKNRRSQEFAVIGWTEGKGGRRGDLGALLLAVRRDGAWSFAGRVGTGFDTAERARWMERLASLARSTAPVPVPSPVPNAHWVEPQHVVEVEFTEWSPEGLLRHPSYRGWRPDKSPRDAVEERPVDAEEDSHA